MYMSFNDQKQSGIMTTLRAKRGETAILRNLRHIQPLR